jgi:hypothetical protein
MNSMQERDPVHDPDLRSALLRAEGEVPWDAESAARLGDRVLARAELPLARRRKLANRERRWSRLRPLAPLAAAAGLGGLLLLGPRLAPTGAGEAEGLYFPAALRPAVEEILGTRISEEEFLLFTGAADAELLLTAAIDLN